MVVDPGISCSIFCFERHIETAKSLIQTRRVSAWCLWKGFGSSGGSLQTVTVWMGCDTQGINLVGKIKHYRFYSLKALGFILPNAVLADETLIVPMWVHLGKLRHRGPMDQAKWGSRSTELSLPLFAFIQVFDPVGLKAFPKWCYLASVTAQKDPSSLFLNLAEVDAPQHQCSCLKSWNERFCIFWKK